MEISTIIKEKLEFLLNAMTFEIDNIDIEYLPERDLYRANIQCDHASALIGHHGETLNAIQHVLKALLWKNKEENFKVLVDIDDYRKNQEESILSLIKRKIEIVRETTLPQDLPPMSPYFRRFAHMYIASQPDLESESHGEGNSRHVSIKLK
jgi:spoIIIJ-associated protein